MPKSYHNPSTVFKPTGYTHAVKATGSTIYLAGQVGVGPDGKLVGKGDAKAQAEQAWKNIKNVLESVGAKLSDIVEVTTFAVHAEDAPGIKEVRLKHLPEKNLPAATLVVCSALARPELLVEIKVVAVIG